MLIECEMDISIFDCKTNTQSGIIILTKYELTYMEKKSLTQEYLRNL
jgi:hypothetical protein